MLDQTILDIVIRANNQASGVFKDVAGDMSGVHKAAAITAAATTGAFIAIGAASVKMAADFQQQTTTLVTTAGESEKNLGMVRSGILEISSQTGTSAKDMATAMYTIESAGYHGADGLNILKAAAQGAKTENANLQKVADAVTSTMRDYHKPATDAADVTSKLVAAVGAGKATFEEFTGSLHSVLPIASAAHISLDDILGDVASMTVHGMSADQATQNLANAIRTLQSPSQSAQQYLYSIGINAADLSDKLSHKGLSGTLEEISQAIMQHMGPSGKVLIDSFNQSKAAAADANEMISKMPANLQSLAKQYMAGKISAEEWGIDLKGMDTKSANLAKQFQSVANKATGFNNLLKSGSPSALSYSQALQKATGNATTMNVALMLTGENAEYTANAVKAVGNAHAEAGHNVAGWSLIQGNFNQVLSQAKESLLNTAIALGTALLPALTSMLKSVMGVIEPIAEWTNKHKTLTAIIFTAITAIAAITTAILFAHSIFGKITTAVNVFKDSQIIASAATKAMTAAQWLMNAAMDANPIGLVVIAIAALAVVVGVMIANWKKITDALKPVFSFFNDNIRPILITIWNIIKQQLMKAWDDMRRGFENAMKALKPYEPQLKIIGGLILAALVAPLVIAVATIALAIGAIVAIGVFLVRFIGWLADVTGAIIKWVVGFGNGIGQIIESINTTGAQIGNWFNELPGRILGWLAGAGRWLWNTGVSIIQGLVNGVVAMANDLWNGISNVSSVIGRFFAGAGGWLVDVGRNIIQGLINGVSSMMGAAVNSVQNVAGNVVSGIKNLLGIHSPSTVFHEIGTNIGQGLANGIKATHGLVKDATSGLVATPNGNMSVSSLPVANGSLPSASSIQSQQQGGVTFNVGTIKVEIGMYSGSANEKQQVAIEIWQALMKVARSHNMANNIPDFGIRAS